MNVKVDTENGEVIVKSSDGGSVDVREFNPHCAYTGDMAVGEARTCDDGSVVIRVGELLMWGTPADWEQRRAQAAA